jgi:calmodulin
MFHIWTICRYDESCSGEVDYSEFVEKVMEKDFKHASSASQNALNTLVSSTFLHQDGLSLEDDDSDIDEDELEQFRLAEVKNLFNLVDNDCSGVIDRTEMTELLNKLGKTLSDDVINMGFNKIDSDSSGHIDFDEFYAWYKSVAYSKKNNVDD